MYNTNTNTNITNTDTDAKHQCEAFNCITYIENNGIDRNPVSPSNKDRLALVEHCIQLEQDNRTLFHLSITYKMYQNRIYTEKEINTFFENFYRKSFLPELLNTRYVHKDRFKIIQPIVFCFVDEHEHDAKRKSIMNPITNKLETVYYFPNRLHHHAIIAVHKDTLSKMQLLVGVSTIKKKKWSNKVMTTDIKQCGPERILYSSKMYSRYPEYQIFPDFNPDSIAA